MWSIFRIVNYSRELTINNFFIFVGTATASTSTNSISEFYVNAVDLTIFKVG